MSEFLHWGLFRRNKKPGLEGMRDAAERGDSEAQYVLGLKFSRNAEPGFDTAEAVRWFRRAADQNHSQAQLCLGLMYSRGQEGLPRDEREGLRLIRLAAEHGH